MKSFTGCKWTHATANWKTEQVPDTSVSTGYVRRDVRGVSLLPPGLFFYPRAGIEKLSDHDESYPNGVIMSVTSALRRLKTSSYDGSTDLIAGNGMGAAAGIEPKMDEAKLKYILALQQELDQELLRDQGFGRLPKNDPYKKLKKSSYDGAPELIVGGGLGALGAGVGSYYGANKSVRGVNDRANALLTEINKPLVEAQSKLDDILSTAKYLGALESDLRRDLWEVQDTEYYGHSDYLRERELRMKIDDAIDKVDTLDLDAKDLRGRMNEILPGIKAESAKITDDAAIAARKAARNWRIGGGLGVAAGLGALGLGLHRLANNDPYGSLKTSSDNSTGLIVGGGLGAAGSAAGSYLSYRNRVGNIFDQLMDEREINRNIADNEPLSSARSKLIDLDTATSKKYDDLYRKAVRNRAIAGGLGIAAGLGVAGLGLHRKLAKNKLGRETYGA